MEIKRNILTEEEKNFVKELSERYDYAESSVRKILAILKEYPCIVNGEQEKLFECLEEIVADRSTDRKLKDSIEEMVFRVYGEESINYLSDNYKDSRGIDPLSEYIDFDASLDELEYNGWIKLVR